MRRYLARRYRRRSQLRRDKLARKHGRPRSGIRTKVRPARYADFAFEVHLNDTVEDAAALEMVRATLGRYRIVRAASRGFRRRGRCRVYLGSETDLLLLKMAHADTIYRVYRLVDAKEPV